MMGDNRDNSLDSRTKLMVRDLSGATGERAQHGWYVPAENLVGRAEFIFFSHDPSAAGWLEPWKWPQAIVQPHLGRFFMAMRELTAWRRIGHASRGPSSLPRR